MAEGSKQAIPDPGVPVGVGWKQQPRCEVPHTAEQSLAWVGLHCCTVGVAVGVAVTVPVDGGLGVTVTVGVRVSAGVGELATRQMYSRWQYAGILVVASVQQPFTPGVPLGVGFT